MAEGSAVVAVTRTAGESATSRRGERATARPAAAVAPRRTFRLPEVVLGVLLVAGCALGALVWQKSVNKTRMIVVAARPIRRGSAITADDLRGAQIGGDTRAMISGADARTLLGEVALVDIAIDVPLTSTLLAPDTPLGLDEALTSMALEPGQLPPDLAPGDNVRVVATAAAVGSTESTATLLDQTVTVWAVSTAPDGVTTIVTVRGPLSLTVAIAAATHLRIARVAGS